MTDVAMFTFELASYISFTSSGFERAFLLFVELGALGPDAFGIKVRIHLPDSYTPKTHGVCSYLGPGL